MLSKGNLKDISIDADSLEALQKMLLKAGFKESEVHDLMVELSGELEEKNLTLDSFLDKFFDLPLEVDSETITARENFLEISVIPFLESILNSLEIPREKIQEILIEADKGEKGISLDVVIEKLQAVLKKSFYTRNDYKTQKDDYNFKMLLKQLGLEQNDSKTSPLTLNEFVSSLEKLRTKISQYQSPAEAIYNIEQKPDVREKPLDLFNALFKGLEFKGKEAETQAFKLFHENVRDQFKNELLVPIKKELLMSAKNELPVPGNEITNKNDLFAANRTFKNEAGLKLKNSLKEVAPLLDGKKSIVFDAKGQVKDQITENKEFFRQLKPETTKLVDQGQISTLGAKTDDTQSSLNILKTKASFKNLPTYVTHQVSKSLVRAINQGENILRIQLKPPELGRLMMTIDNTGNSIKVTIMTENYAAKEILASNVNELRSVLSNSGVNLERFDVDMNSNFRQSMADARNQAGNSAKRHRNREKFLLDHVHGEGMNDASNLSEILNQGSSLHFVA